MILEVFSDLNDSLILEVSLFGEMKRKKEGPSVLGGGRATARGEAPSRGEAEAGVFGAWGRM